jgi:hypothetical protein
MQAILALQKMAVPAVDIGFGSSCTSSDNHCCNNSNDN